MDILPTSDPASERLVRRVMIVDDDECQLGALEQLVSAWGLTVVPFDRFEWARAQLTSIEPSPDALIVDVRLGMFNGLQLVHLAKQRHPGLTVIVMSGFDDPVIRQDTADAGATFLLKPLDPIELERRLLGRSSD